MARTPLRGSTAARKQQNAKRKAGEHPTLYRPKGTRAPPKPEAKTGGRKITTFERILVDGIREGKVPARSIEARKWFRDKASRSRVQPGALMEQERSRMVAYPKIGRMYLFNYDPKWKEKLPYYDTYPLIFPIERAKGGFLGINLHYLPPKLRAMLMDKLYDLAVMGEEPYDSKTYLGISYGILNSASKYDAFKPCIKHYLASHVRSRFMSVYPAEWDMALFLPLARFQKAKKEKVWRDSERIING